MKHVLHLFVVLTLGCSQTSPPANVPDLPAAGVQTMNEDVALSLKITKVEERQVQLTGTTNLPPETKLIVSLDGEPISETVVSTEKTFGPVTFGSPGGLSDGKHLANVTMPMSAFQPDNVRQVIGKKGEHLAGPLVDEEYKSVSIEEEFKIGD